MTTQSRREKVELFLERQLSCSGCPLTPGGCEAPMMGYTCFTAIMKWIEREEPVAPAPVWTDELPREEGHYYWREGRTYPPQVFYIFHKAHTLWVSKSEKWPIIPIGSLPDKCGQWSTRIPEPVEDKK